MAGHETAPPRHFFRRLIKRVFIGIGAIVFLAFAAVATVFGFALLAYKSYAADFVAPDRVAINRPSAGAKIYDRNGQLLYQYVDDKDGIRMPISLPDVSPAFLAATIATEDRDFFQNPGVNPRGLARAAIENFNEIRYNTAPQGTGGSSITQQLVKNVYIPEKERHERTITRKLREIVFSTELTKRYDKAQILDWYINQISYGGIYTGVEAASEGYFGKPAKDLTLAEAALLAGIPQSPSSFDPLVDRDASIRRRNEVLDLMARHPTLQVGQGLYYTPNPSELAAAHDEAVVLHPQAFPIQAPHFVLSYIAPELGQLVGKDAVLHDGLVVTTSLDLDLQGRAQRILNRSIDQYERASNTHNGAIAIFKPGTGEILAMIGSRDFFRDDINGEVNNLLGLRSPGSSFKPFVYLSAFMKLGWTPGTVIQDSPIVYREIDGSAFQPQNPVKNSYQGPTSVRKALGNSLNVPAFKTALQLGAPSVVAQAKSMGFTNIDRYYGPSIAIGGVDLHGLDLAYGYSTLANGGMLVGQNSFAPLKPDESPIQPVAILKIVNGKGETVYNVDDHRAQYRVAPADDVYMITDVLSDPSAVCVTFGCGGLNVPGYKVAAKTGTSQPFDQNGPNADKYGETWAFGYTADYAVGVWAGNSNYAPVTNIFSTTIAFPVMRDVMLAAYNGAPQRPSGKPANVSVKQSCAPVANLPFLARAPGSVDLAPFPTSPSCSSTNLAGN